MKLPSGSAVLVAAVLALSACGESHPVLGRGPPHRLGSTLPAPLAKRFAAEARGIATSLGDPSAKTALVYGPNSRYALVKASSGDLVQKNAGKGYYLLVLYGHFVCGGCTGPAPGAKPARGKIATEVLSAKVRETDFGLGNRPIAMSQLRGPSLIRISG